MSKVFHSKRDLWIVILIWAGMLAAAFAAVVQFRSGAPLLQRLLILGTSVVVVAVVLSMVYNSRYTLGTTDLQVSCGPIRYTIPLAAIDLVRPSRNPLSSPAASLDRLLIRWDDGRKRVLISPQDKMAFMDEVQSRCAHLARVGDELVRVSSSA